MSIFERKRTNARALQPLVRFEVAIMVKHIGGPAKIKHKGGVAKPHPHATASCGHRTCDRLRLLGAARGVGVFLYNQSKACVLMGLERFGQYAGHLNLCGGRMDPQDRGCYINAAIRELREEFKVSLSYDDFENTFRNFRKTSIRFMMVNKTPVLVGAAQWIEDLSRRVLNQKIW